MEKNLEVFVHLFLFLTYVTTRIVLHKSSNRQKITNPIGKYFPGRLLFSAVVRWFPEQRTVFVVPIILKGSTSQEFVAQN